MGTTRDKIKVKVIRHPESYDWERCKDLALRTIGKKWTGSKVTELWKENMLKCRHSPIRTLMFTIEMELPYYVSTHFVRHKFGVEHFVQSQRNDRQSNYDRDLAPQSAMVMHTMDINAEALMNMAHRRLCTQADITTRYVMTKICQEVIRLNPEFKKELVPQCEYLGRCPEFMSCGKYQTMNEMKTTLNESDLCPHY